MGDMEDAWILRRLPLHLNYRSPVFEVAKQYRYPSGRLARWALELSQWDFELKYRKRSEYTVADILSRQPIESCVIERPIECQ